MRTLNHLRGNLVAYLALAAALGTGSAYAADKLGSADIAKQAIRAKHIKDGQVTTKDVKDASLQASDFAPGALPNAGQAAPGIAGPAGERGPAGPAGPEGPQGEPGISAFEESIPSGTTVTGSFGHTQPLATGKKLTFHISLPVPAPVALSNEKVNFAAFGPGGSELDPECVGTREQPTAPPGKVCLYYAGSSGATDLEGLGSERHGFAIQMTASGGNPDFVGTSGTWAYTAP